MLRPIIILATVFIFSFANVQPLKADTCASWADAEKSLRSAWLKGYPGEKIIKIEQNGQPSSYEKFKSTGKTKIDEHGDKWEYYTKNKFCQVPARVLVQQSSGQRIFNVSAIFRMSGNKFIFDNMGVGDSYAVAESGQQPPTKDEIKKLIASYWLEKNPKTKVVKVAISAPELKKDSSTGRWWYTTGADIYTVDENGRNKKCSNDYTTIHKGEKGKEGVDPSGSWKVYFLDDMTCN